MLYQKRNKVRHKKKQQTNTNSDSTKYSYCKIKDLKGGVWAQPKAKEKNESFVLNFRRLFVVCAAKSDEFQRAGAATSNTRPL